MPILQFCSLVWAFHSPQCWKVMDIGSLMGLFVAHPRENEHPPNTGQVGTKWSKIGFPLISPDYCLFPHCQTSAGWLSAIGAQPLIHLGPDSHDCVLFLSQAPAARNKSKRGSWQCESNLFSICCQDAVFHSEMKSDSEIWIQWTALLSGSNNYNDRSGNCGVFSFWEWGSDHAENGEIKGGGVQIVYIDFRKKSVTLRGSVSFGFEGLEGKPLRETNDISNAQWYSSQKPPVFCLSCV